MPSGIFQPYAGVSTNILLLDKTIAKNRDSIAFVELKNDGYSLSTQRKPISGNEIPRLCESLLNYKYNSVVSDDILLVSKEKIAENKYDLTINKYRESIKIIYDKEPPINILKRIECRNKEYNVIIESLKEVIK